MEPRRFRFFEPAVWALFAVVAVSGASLWFALDPGPIAPTNDEWSAVAELISTRVEKGDALRIHPFWLREGAIVAQKVGETRLTLDLSVPLDPMVLYGQKRLWVVQAFDRTDAAAPPGASLVEESRLPGGLLVQLYDMPSSPVLADLRLQLPRAVVERFAKGTPKRVCRWNGQEHDCRGRPWETVKLEQKEIGGAPRTCFVLHPYPSGGTVAVRFPGMTLGAGILVRAGFTLDAAKSELGTDAQLTIKVGGDVVQTRTERRNGWDFVPSYVDTSARRGERADVTIEVTADNEEFRDLCVDGFIVSRPVPEADAARRCQSPSSNPGPGGC